MRAGVKPGYAVVPHSNVRPPVQPRRLPQGDSRFLERARIVAARQPFPSGAAVDGSGKGSWRVCMIVSPVVGVRCKPTYGCSEMCEPRPPMEESFERWLELTPSLDTD